jgi:protein-S-isoprenylcysteine O-methyltransferase Ste14
MDAFPGTGGFEQALQRHPSRPEFLIGLSKTHLLKTWSPTQRRVAAGNSPAPGLPARIRAMLAFIRTVGWLAGITYSTIPAYWLMIHPRAAYWRSRKRSPYLLLLPLWAATWIALGAATWRWRAVAFYSNPWTWAPAILLFAIGIWLYWRSSADFSRAQLGGFPEVLPGHRDTELVTAGIRARVRHPVYLAHLCEIVAWTIGTGLLVLFVLTGVTAITGAIMIRAEDAELERRFGEQYRSYRRQVPALFPKF